MNKLNVIDLFAGCGGLSLGFRKAGFKVPIHLEINENFCKTLEENSLPEEIVINEDITKYETGKIIPNNQFISRMERALGTKLPRCKKPSKNKEDK